MVLIMIMSQVFNVNPSARLFSLLHKICCCKNNLLAYIAGQSSLIQNFVTLPMACNPATMCIVPGTYHVNSNRLLSVNFAIT